MVKAILKNIPMSKLKFVNAHLLSEIDLSRVAKIDNAIPLEHDPDFHHKLSLEDRIVYFKSIKISDFFQVVFDDQEIVGFHIVNDIGQSIGMIVTLWVHPKYRHQGIAKQLKQLALEWAEKNQLEYLQTTVQLKNQRMLLINQQNGFESFSVNMRKKL